MDQLRPGLVLGCRFRLVGPVGGRGPGSVWRAVDETSGRDVAVKTLRTRSANGDRAGIGLALATVAALSNPGIAQVHDYGEEPAADGRPAIPYLVRDLVPGPTLEERLAGGSLPAAEALRFVAAAADALAAAHRSGVVHGNLVPANVIDGPAGVKVTDFGLSALRERPPGERLQSVLSYAAPERLSGGPATMASDMYSLGVLFVACLSGIAAAGTSGSPPVTDPAADPVTPGLAALWAACLGASPRERPSAAHVAFMSHQALAAQPAVAAHADGEPGQYAGPDSGTAGPGLAREGVAGERPAPVPVGRWVPDGAPARAGGPGATGPPGRGGRPGSGAGPDRGRRGRGTGPGSRRTPRDRLGLAGRGRARLIVFGAAGATGVAVAAVVLTQFLTSPAAQTRGASATPTAHVTGSRPAGVARPTSHPLPSADATSTSVLASASPPPIQVLNQIQATIRRGVASGQIRQDVGVDLTNLLQPFQTELAAGNTTAVSQLARTLKAKLAIRLGEGAITKAAVAELDRELAILAKSVAGR
ncbi:MAG TPA: serine/threonine-protein kinase [Streptosporangiaceae bacterium]|nr:serine/threonine-protein kinase [Streptosporangiaceae bacterium]